MITVTQNKTALAVGRVASFVAAGGVEPYVFSVRPHGAGGSIDQNGIYTAPAAVDPDPSKAFDVIQVRDSVGGKGTARIMVGTPLMLFCEILQQELGLADGRVYLWDQKLMQPTDAGLYIAVSILSSKVFGNTNAPVSSSSGLNSVQSVNMMATMQLDIISRGPEARDRKEEVIMALNSTYAQQQMEQNSFLIGRIPPGGQFMNLSAMDGAAIPYRFTISVNMQYFYTKTKAPDYFNNYSGPTIVTNS